MPDDRGEALFEAAAFLGGGAGQELVHAALGHPQEPAGRLVGVQVRAQVAGGLALANLALAGVARGSCIYERPIGPAEIAKGETGIVLADTGRLAATSRPSRRVSNTASDDAREINGANIPIDGGMAAGFFASTLLYLGAAEMLPG